MPIIEKARGKVALAPGYSLAAWMRLSKGADLTGGVGVVDEDEEEETWPVWSLEELAKHNTPQDAWMAVRGKVYNITPYLPYHPGGVDTLLEAAGTDGTVLFDKYHKWVNADGILAACCVGTLAKPGCSMATDSGERGRPSELAGPGGTEGRGEEDTPAVLLNESTREKPRVKRVRWDEPALKAHDVQRGVMFGTMKIDQLDTPFLYLEDDGSEYTDVAIHPAYLKSHVPTASQTGAPRPHKMEVDELQHALGLSSLIERIRAVETDADGCAILSPRWTQTDEFGAQRQASARAAHPLEEPHNQPLHGARPLPWTFQPTVAWLLCSQALYRDEARIAALAAGLSDGWTVSLSSSEAHEPFYHHRESGVTQWDRPG